MTNVELFLNENHVIIGLICLVIGVIGVISLYLIRYFERLKGDNYILKEYKKNHIVFWKIMKNSYFGWRGMSLFTSTKEDLEFFCKSLNDEFNKKRKNNKK